MSTYMERQAQFAINTAIAASARQAASLLQAQINQLIKNEASPFILEPLQLRLTSIWDRHRQAVAEITRLEQEQAAQHVHIRVINVLGNRAEIVIHYMVDHERKVSFTRRVHFNGKDWIGLSTLSRQRIVYHFHASVEDKAA